MNAAPISSSANTDWTALRPFGWLIFALFIAEVTGSFESAMIIAAMKYLIQEFGDPALVGWLVTSYLIVGAAAAALVGRLGDIFGRRRVLLITLTIGLLGSLISALATDFTWLLVGRIMQGMTGAILALCIGLVRENIPAQHVPMGIGLMISGASLGTAAGLILGGWIADNYSWHGVFFASAAFCTSTIIAALAFVPKSPRGAAADGIDWFSGILFAPGIMALLFYVGSIAKKGLFDPLGLMALGSGSALLAFWLWRSLRAEQPLLDVRQFKNRNVLVANIVTAFVALSSLQITLIFAILLQAPLWTGVGLGVTSLVSGLAKLPSNLVSTFAGPLSGWLTGRGGGRSAMLAGGTLAAVGWILALFFHDSLGVVVAVLCVISFGTTILFAVGPTILAEAVPPDRTSEVSGMLTVVRGLFQGIGAMIITTLLATEVVSDPSSKAQYPTEWAFQVTLCVVILFSVMATLCAFALPKGRAISTGQI
jgi:MFS family permease